MMASEQSVFRALADPSRRMILMRLSKKDMTIGEVASQFDMTRAAIKKHLTILEQGKLISVHARGRERINRLNSAGLKPVSEWIGYFNQFWDDRLNQLQAAINETEGKTNG